MGKEYEIHYLSTEFYQKYNSKDYPEIEKKLDRPHMVIFVKIEDNLFAIPFRTNIRHNNCFRFKRTDRDTVAGTGLDYTKAVIVNDDKYIGSAARVDDKEYAELRDRYGFIIKQFRKYVSDYISFVNGKNNYYTAKKYKYTTLTYFHKELGIDK